MKSFWYKKNHLLGIEKLLVSLIHYQFLMFTFYSYFSSNDKKSILSYVVSPNLFWDKTNE